MRALFVPAVIFAFALSAVATPRATIQGTIINGENGLAIRGAFVLLHNSSSSSPDYVAQNSEMWTAADGNFSFVIEPGCYDIFVSATLFLPFARKVCIQDERAPVLKVKMKADKNVRLSLR